MRAGPAVATLLDTTRYQTVHRPDRKHSSFQGGKRGVMRRLLGAGQCGGTCRARRAAATLAFAILGAAPWAVCSALAWTPLDSVIVDRGEVWLAQAEGGITVLDLATGRVRLRRPSASWGRCLFPIEAGILEVQYGSVSLLGRLDAARIWGPTPAWNNIGYAAGIVVVADERGLRGLDAESGHERWAYSVPDFPSFLVEDDTVVLHHIEWQREGAIGTILGRLDLATGRAIQTTPPPSIQRPTGGFDWKRWRDEAIFRGGYIDSHCETATPPPDALNWQRWAEGGSVVASVDPIGFDGATKADRGYLVTTRPGALEALDPDGRTRWVYRWTARPLPRRKNCYDSEGAALDRDFTARLTAAARDRGVPLILDPVVTIPQYSYIGWYQAAAAAAWALPIGLVLALVRWVLRDRDRRELPGGLVSLLLAGATGFAYLRLGWTDPIQAALQRVTVIGVGGVALVFSWRSLFRRRQLLGCLAPLAAMATALALYARYFLVSNCTSCPRLP